MQESEDENHLWTFAKVINHQRAKLDGKETMEVEVPWDTGEKTWEQLHIIKADDPVLLWPNMRRKKIYKIN